MRLFIGVKISMAAVAELADAVAAMRAEAEAVGLGVRWVAPASYHVTLAFLGEARPEVVPAIRDAVSGAVSAIPAFTIATAAPGAFPDLARARVSWMGVDDPDRGLERLARAVADAVEPLGFARERRPFHPHVTIARLRNVANVEPMLLRCPEQKRSETRVAQVFLFENVIKSDSSEYRERAIWSLPAAHRHTGPVQRALDPVDNKA